MIREVKNKPFTWSPSSIKVAKTCMLKWWGTYVTPNPPPYVEGPAQAYGNKVHKALEDAVALGQPLPPELKQLNKWVASVNKLPGDKVCEGKFAFDRQWQPTGYFDSNVWGRIVVDLRIQDGTRQANVIDWKTGKSQYVDNDQLELSLIAAKAIEPETQQFAAGYVFTEEDKLSDLIRFDSNGIEMLKAKHGMQIAKMEEAWNTGRFEPTKNGLCRNYCDVFDCPFNGRRKKA